MGIESFGRALVYRNYRLFLLGQGISLIGTWMQQVAMSWMVYRLTGSTVLLGLMSFWSQIPSLVLSPLAGVLADRCHRHRAIIVTQSLAMLQAVLVLVVSNYSGPVIWPLMALGFFLGVINAFDMPLRQSFLSEMVPDKNHLVNAIALNSSIVNGARLVGPSLAGIVIAARGESFCFLVNAVSYIAVILALLAMRDLPVRSKSPAGSVLFQLHEGLSYAAQFAPIRALLLLLALVSFMSTVLGVLIPVFAKDILAGDAKTQGLLLGASGLGALAAALYLASRNSVLGLGRVIVAAAMLYGIGQIAFSYSDRLTLSVPALVMTGYCMMLHMAASNTLIQTIADEDKRGRVMSLYAMALLGIGPLGSLTGGFVAAHLGTQFTVRLAGCCCIAGALLFGWQLPKLRRLVRPIYEQAGILPKAMSVVPPVQS